MILAQHQLSAPNRPNKMISFWYGSIHLLVIVRPLCPSLPATTRVATASADQVAERSQVTTRTTPYGVASLPLAGERRWKAPRVTYSSVILQRPAYGVKLTQQSTASRRKLQRWVNNRQVRVMQRKLLEYARSTAPKKNTSTCTQPVLVPILQKIKTRKSGHHV